MDTVLKTLVKNQISSLKGMAFQLFINELFTTIHGNNFTVIKQKHDQGSDGILNQNTIISCYAPEKADIKDFRKKMNNDKLGSEGDFQKYQQNWASKYPNWMVVYNGDCTAAMVLDLKALKPDFQHIGLDNIMGMIDDDLNWTKQQRIFEYLQIPEEYIKSDLVNQIIRDLIKRVDNKDELSGKDIVKGLSTDLSDKVELNYSQEDLEYAIVEVQNYLQIATLIEETLINYTQLGALKLKVQKDYLNLSSTLSFKEHKKILQEQYAGKRKDDEVYCYYIDMFLLYIFEQCLIGKKK